MNRRYRKQLAATDEIQATYAAQQAAFEAQLDESRRAMDRNAAQQAEYDAQLEESRRSAARHSELLAASEETQARQEAQIDAVDALIDRWTALTDKFEQLVEGSRA